MNNDADEVVSFASGNSSLSSNFSNGKHASHDPYDEEFEDIHANLSKRSAIRSSLNNTSSASFGSSGGKYLVSNEKFPPQNVCDGTSGDIRDTVRSSIQHSNTSTNRSNVGSSHGRRKGKNLSNRENRTSDKRSSHSRKARNKRRSSGNESCASTVASGVSAISKDDSAHSRRRHRKSDRSTDEKKTRTPSAIKRLLEYDESGDNSSIGNDKDKKSVRTRKGKSSGHNRSRSVPRSRSKSRSNTGKIKPRSVERGVSAGSVPLVVSKDDTTIGDNKVRRRSKSQQHSLTNIQNNRRRGASDRKKIESTPSKSSVSLHSMRTYIGKGKPEPRGTDSFEEVWTDNDKDQDKDQDKDKAPRSPVRRNGFMDTTISSRPPPSENEDEKGDISLNGNKKTKLDKIKELQAKCDRYKTDLRKMAEENKKYRRKADGNREEIVSLKKIVEEYEVEFTRLQTKVADVQDDLEIARNEQRDERNDLSDAARDLAQVNIDYAKSVDEARTVKLELDRQNETLKDREKKIAALEEDLRRSTENVKQFEADVLYADEQIDALESEVKKYHVELTAYKEAVQRDSISGSNGNGGVDNLRKANEEAEKRKLEEREKSIKQKSKLLEEQLQEFEAEKKLYLEEQQQKEQYFEEKRAFEEREANKNDGDREKKEEEINGTLKKMEDENAALKGQLKSEQLDSTMKLQKKDDAIAGLQQEVARLTKKENFQRSDPDNTFSLSLLQQIETLKADAVKTKVDYEDANMKKVELKNEVNDLQLTTKEMETRMSSLEAELTEQKLELDYQKRKTVEWQKKSGEWSDKAFKWKSISENWEKKARESNHDSNGRDGGSVKQDPQALFLQAAVEKQAVNTAGPTGNNNTGWQLRGLFGQSSKTEDEAKELVEKLCAENASREAEIHKLLSDMVKMKTTFKEEAYSKAQEFEKLKKEKDKLEETNANFSNQLELARKLNRTISDSMD